MKNTTLARLTFLIVAVPLSVYVAPTLQQAAAAHGYKTPGAMAEALVPVPPPPNELANLGESIALLWASNAAVILLVLCSLYALAEWRWRRSQRKAKA